MPTATPSRSAISLCVWPSRCCSLTISRSSGFEAVDGGADAPHHFDLLGTRRQRDERTIGRVGLVECSGGTPLFLAERVDRCATCDRREPRREVATGLELVGVAPGLQEHVLRDVFGSLPIVEHPVRHGEHEATEALVEGSNRIVVAVAKCERELGVALHFVGWTELLHGRRQRIGSDQFNGGQPTGHRRQGRTLATPRPTSQRIAEAERALGS